MFEATLSLCEAEHRFLWQGLMWLRSDSVTLFDVIDTPMETLAVGIFFVIAKTG